MDWNEECESPLLIPTWFVSELDGPAAPAGLPFEYIGEVAEVEAEGLRDDWKEEDVDPVDVERPRPSAEIHLINTNVNALI